MVKMQKIMICWGTSFTLFSLVTDPKNTTLQPIQLIQLDEYNRTELNNYPVKNTTDICIDICTGICIGWRIENLN